MAAFSHVLVACAAAHRAILDLRAQVPARHCAHTGRAPVMLSSDGGVGPAQDTFMDALDGADLAEDDGEWGEWVIEELEEVAGQAETEQGTRREDDRDEIWDMSLLPLVAIVGRPNVGKSMIVNRLSRQYQGGSIVYDSPGITRDRTYRPAYWGDREFRVRAVPPPRAPWRKVRQCFMEWTAFSFCAGRRYGGHRL